MYLALRSFVHEDFTGLWPHVSAQSRFVTGKRKRIVLSYSCESACRMTIQKIGIRYRAGDKVRGLFQASLFVFHHEKIFTSFRATGCALMRSSLPTLAE